MCVEWAGGEGEERGGRVLSRWLDDGLVRGVGLEGLPSQVLKH